MERYEREEGNAMNFIFISPQFPHTYWNFCDRLRRNGVNVLGIGDGSYDEMDERLKGALTEYYRVNSLENYDEVFRAVAFSRLNTGKSTGWNPIRSTGWSRMPDCGRISILRQGRGLTRSRATRASLP